MATAAAPSAAQANAVAAEANGGRLDRVTEIDIDFPVPDVLFEQQWSCVPVVCTLAESESVDGTTKRCQFVVPRQSFLYHYTYTKTIANSICNFAKGSGCRWFSYRSSLFPKSDIYLPLPIQYPVSVLCDLVAAELGVAGSIPAFRAPLKVRIHFTEPRKEDYEAMCKQVPPAQVPNLPTWESFLQRYQAALRLDNARSGYKWHRHTLKQTLMARFGSAQALSMVERDMPKQGTELFQAVINNQAEGFWKALCCIEQCGEMRSKQDAQHLVAIHFNAWQTQWIVCKSSSQKLGLFLKEHVEAFGGLEREQCHANQVSHVVFVQGLNPMLSTPMDALFECFVSVDLCLHIVLKGRAAIEQYLTHFDW